MTELYDAWEDGKLSWSDIVGEPEPERCECGHGPDSHEAAGFRQNSRTGKSHWKRYCRGHKGYTTLTGEKPCRCRGYVQAVDHD